MHDMVYWSRQYVTAIFLRFSEYLIFWWLSTRWTWLISVKIYINKIIADYKKMSETLNIKNVVFIPISAKDGDNVVNKSEKTPWYDGPTLLNYLETVPVGHKTMSDFFRFPVQYVIRPISSQFPDYLLRDIRCCRRYRIRSHGYSPLSKSVHGDFR